MKWPMFVLIILSGGSIIAQTNPIGIFQNHTDVGNPKVKGAVSYDKDMQSYNIKGGGYNIWFNRDEFHYA